MSNVVKQLAGGGSGQSVRDRFSAAKYTISGEGLGRAVSKASTEQIAAPKKKHVDYLVQCTNEPNVSIPKMADYLIGRLQHHNWVTVYKALITTHQIMNYGNERFLQYLASNNCTLSLPTFFDRSSVHGSDMSTFVRRYSKYLQEKTNAYRAMAFDFCKVKRGKEDGMLRLMPIDRLLKAAPVLQSQVDALLEFDAQANDLHNGVINASFILLFKDLIRLFACYNDSMINLLEKYFDLPRKQCREAFDLYKRFLIRMDKVCQFLRVAEAIGIDKGEIPDLTRAPASLLEALETHLAALESGQPTPASAAIPKSSSVSGGMPARAATVTATNVEDEKRRILEEEARRIEAYEKSRARSAMASSSAQQSTPAPAPAAAAAAPPNPFDLFGASPPQPAKPAATIDQLFSLEEPVSSRSSAMPVYATPNPFMAFNSAQPAPAAVVNPFLFTAAPVNTTAAWPTNSNAAGAFGGPIDFDSAFATAKVNGSGAGASGGILQPTNGSAQAPKVAAQSVAAPATTNPQSLVTNDIDASMASLADKLTFSAGYRKQDWSGSNAQPKQPIGAAVASGAASSPFNNSPQPLVAGNARPLSASSPWNAGPSGILQPQPVATQPVVSGNAVLQSQLPQLYAIRPGMPVGGAYAPVATAGMPFYPAIGMPAQQVAWPYGQQMPPSQPNDPFGAL